MTIWLPVLVSQSVIRLNFSTRMRSLLRWIRGRRAARHFHQDLKAVRQAQLTSGAVRNRAALAQLHGVTRARVTQVLGAAVATAAS